MYVKETFNAEELRAFVMEAVDNKLIEIIEEHKIPPYIQDRFAERFYDKIYDAIMEAEVTDELLVERIQL